MKKYLYLAIFIIIIFPSCTWYNEEELYPNEDCDTSNITYNLDIQPIFEQNCYTCHIPNTTGTYDGNLNMKDTNDIKRVVDNGNLLSSIKHVGKPIPMPKGGAKLSDCKILKIENWINHGAIFK